MAKHIEKEENRELMKIIAKHGAIPLNAEGLMSKIRFGKLASTKFVQMK